MKTVKLKVANLERGGVQQTISSKGIFKDCINFVAPETGGLNISGQKERLRLMDIIDGVKDNDTFIKLEDADFEVLHKCFKQMKWGLVHPLIIEMEEQLNKLAETSETKKK